MVNQVVGPTISEFVQEAGMGITILHLPPGAFDWKIRWVAYTELEDPTPYLRGGELVLTSGKSFDATDPELALEFLKRLKAAGMLGLGIGVERIYPEAPKTLVLAAAEIDFPLLSIPARTSFATISRFVTDRVGHYERRIYQQPLADQQNLIRASILSDAPYQIAKVLHRSIEGWAAVWTADGNVVAEVGTRERADEVRLQIQGLAASRRKGAASLHDVNWHSRILPIGSGLEDGYLSLCTRSPTTEAANQTMDTAALLLSAFAQRQRANQQIEQKLQTQLLTALFDQKFETSEAILNLLGLHAFQHNPPVTVAVISPHDAALTEEVMNRLTVVSGLIVGMHRGLVLAISTHDEHKLGLLLKPILSGRATTGIAGAVSLRTAAQALGRAQAAARRLRGDLDVVKSFDQMMSSANPFGIDGDQGLQWSRAILAPLLGLEETDTQELVRTLRVFLQCHGQWSTASRQMFVHRQTLKQRIDRIEFLLGVNLDNAGTRMRLWFALQNIE